MDVTDVIALARAGFDVNQIATIAGALQPAPVQQITQMQQPAPVQQITQMQQPAPVQQPTPAGDQAAAILEKLGVISTQLNSAAITRSRQPAPQTTDDILAAIIAPPRKEV